MSYPIPESGTRKKSMQDCMSYIPETVTSFSSTSFWYRFLERLSLALAWKSTLSSCMCLCVGDFPLAIETLVTAISLIKQSKIAADDRCKILISALQDTLHGIESKSYGSKYALFLLSCTAEHRSMHRLLSLLLATNMLVTLNDRCTL